MFRELRPANDLVYRYAVNAPTIAVPGLTVAGR
jgi:PmbA protein